ncbi:MAG: hypothetical protein RL477_592, partial [Pseudomonadota bacterium]
SEAAPRAVAAPPPAVAAVAPQAPALPDPAVLRGLDGAQVTRLIGAPRFRRADEPAALWRYGAKGCVLDLFMRADGPSWRVVEYQFRRDPKAPAADSVDARACFALLKEAAGAGAGG